MAAVGFLLVCCLAVDFPFLLGRMPYQDDTGRMTAPLMRYYGMWLQRDRLALWNNDLGSGYYQHGAGQSGMLYPPNLILYRLLHWSVAYRASLILHTLAASVCAYLLGLALGLSVLPALLLAVCVGTGGVMAAHQIHINIVIGISHALAMLWLATQWLRRDRPWPWALAGAVVLGLALLGGQPQYVWLAFLMIVVYAAVARSHASSRLPDAASLLGRVLLVLLGGLCLSAVQTVPLYVYSSMYPRPEPAGHYAFITAGSFEWRDFARLSMPAAGLKPEMDMGYWESLGYVGTPALLLALLTAMTRHTRTLGSRYALALIAVGTLLMLGSNTFLYRLLAGLPPFSVFRVPARNVVLVSIGLALLAADYLQSLAAPNRTTPAPSRTLAAVLCITLLSAAAGCMVGPHSTALLEAFLTGVALVSVTVALLARAGNGSSVAAVAVACSVLQLGILWRALNPTAPPEFWNDPPHAAQVCTSRTVHAGEKAACLQPATPSYPPGNASRSPVIDWRDRLAANTCAAYGVPSALLSEAILHPAAMHADTYLHGKCHDSVALIDFCTRLGIKWIVLPPQPLPPPWSVPEPSQPYLYENPDCVGSFFLCERTAPGPGGYLRPAPIGGPYDLRPVHCETLGPGEFLLDFTAPGGSTLFIMQSHYQGWFAALDERPAELQLAHPAGYFMCMAVPAGRHRVRLSFEPWDYDIGLGISAAVAVLMIMTWLMWLLARRRGGNGRSSAR